MRYDRSMSGNDERREKVFVSMNSEGRVVITPAAIHARALKSIGLDLDRIGASRPQTTEIDTAGRLRLPAGILAYFR